MVIGVIGASTIASIVSIRAIIITSMIVLVTIAGLRIMRGLKRKVELQKFEMYLEIVGAEGGAWTASVDVRMAERAFHLRFPFF
ncbi:hypothetical protein CRG98_020074 [Punica granatum]|uniref:Uncharacterized protein n=1 Tax=Punica granatum TaxID=22663 RepID=A0A2I0JVP6_PUNGR|nr:hypothetical protein CRG98_020074 [Punica granatum]